MTNVELKEFLTAFDSKISAKLQAQETITDEVIRPRLDNLIKHVKETNGRVTDLEKQEIIRATLEKNCEKYKFWKISAEVIVASIGAACILQFGILEFLKLI